MSEREKQEEPTCGECNHWKTIYQMDGLCELTDKEIYVLDRICYNYPGDKEK